MGKIVKDDLVKAVARRFDYQSARNVTGKLLKDAGLTKQTDFSADDVKKVGAALTANFDRVDAVLNALAALTAGGDKAPAKAPAKAAAKAPAKAEPKAEPAKAEPKAEAKAEPKAEKAEEAPAEKAPVKKTTRSRTTRKKAPAKKAEA